MYKQVSPIFSATPQEQPRECRVRGCILEHQEIHGTISNSCQSHLPRGVVRVSGSHKKVASAVLMVDREGKQQLVYYVSHALTNSQ